MIIGILEIFLIALLISYIFKRKEIRKVWITYIISLFISGFFVGLFLLEYFLERNSNELWLVVFLIFFFLLIILILQGFSNLMVIGKAFKKEYDNELSSSDILDDDFIK